MGLKHLQGKTLANLTDSDVTGAIRDILGSTVIINSKVYNHLKEVNEALGGIGKQINKINELIKKGVFSDDVLEEAERIRKVLSNQKDRIKNILNKANKII